MNNVTAQGIRAFLGQVGVGVRTKMEWKAWRRGEFLVVREPTGAGSPCRGPTFTSFLQDGEISSDYLASPSCGTTVSLADEKPRSAQRRKIIIFVPISLNFFFFPLSPRFSFLVLGIRVLSRMRERGGVLLCKRSPRTFGSVRIYIWL